MRPLKQLLPSLRSALDRKRLLQIAGSRRTRKWGTGIAIFLVVVGLLGFFAAPPLIRHQAEKQLSLLLSRPVTVGKVSFNPYTLTLQAEQIHVGERDGQGAFVYIGRFLVRVSWSSLFRFKPVVGEVYMDQPRVHMVRTEAQVFNFTDIVERFSKTPAEPKKPSKPTLFYIANIHVDNGVVDFDDRLTGQKHTLDQLMFGIPFIANLPSKADVFVQPFLRTRIDGSTLALEGQIKPFASNFTAVIGLKLDQLDLPWLLSYAPSKLPVQLPKGKLSTDLHVLFVANPGQPQVQISGSADLAGLSLTDAAGQPLFDLDALHLAADAVEPLRNVVHLAQLRIDHPVLWLARDKQGALNLSKLAAPTPAPAPAQGAAAEAPKKAEDEPPAPFDFSLQQLALNDGAIHLRDAQSGANLGLGKLGIEAANVSTLEHKPGSFGLHASLEQGGDLALSGSLDLADKKADTSVTADQLRLPQFQPYLDSALAAQLSQGKAAARLALRADWSGAAFDLKLDDSSLSLDDVRVDAAHGGANLLALTHASANIRKFDLADHNAELSAVELNGLVVNGARAADGSINLTRVLKTTPSAKAQPKAAAAETAPQWKYAVDRVLLDKSTVNFSDSGQPGSQPMSFGVTPLRVEVLHVSSDLSKPWNLDVSTGFKRKGTLTLKGSLSPSPLKLDLQMDGEQIDIAALDPYVTAKLNATIASALLNVKGEVKLAQENKQLKVYYKGDAGLARVRMLDKVTSDLFAGWKSFDIAQIKAAYDERGTRVNLGTLTLSNFYTRVLLNSNGQLNLSNFVVKDNAPTTSLTRANDAGAPPASAAPAAPAQAPTAAPDATSSAPPLQLAFGRILLHSGQVDYSDNFIKPNFSAHLVSIEGDIGAFGTQSTEPARVAVQATLDNNGPVSINGTMNPLVKPPFLDMTATTRDIELTNFSAYSLKYAGYPILKGKLNVDLHYQVDQNQLKADNHIFIDQFTFGDHVDSPSATTLPVRLAISLLKNSRGEIDVDVPVSGSLDDPQFSVGGLIWHAFVNLIEKAVTSPFSLLAGAFGGSEELGYVAFDPGSATLSTAEQQKLETLAKALTDKPGVKLDLSGRVDPAVDIAALKQAEVDRQVKRQKLRDLSGKGDSIDVDSVTVTPAEYGKYLEKAYSAADIKKPRNFIGIAKSLPPDEMKQRLLDSVTVSDNDLSGLAQQRAGAVQQWFSGKVDAGRIYTVAPKLDASGLDGKGPTTRVEFSLQ